MMDSLRLAPLRPCAQVPSCSLYLCSCAFAPLLPVRSCARTQAPLRLSALTSRASGRSHTLTIFAPAPSRPARQSALVPSHIHTSTPLHSVHIYALAFSRPCASCSSGRFHVLASPLPYPRALFVRALLHSCAFAFLYLRTLFVRAFLHYCTFSFLRHCALFVRALSHSYTFTLPPLAHLRALLLPVH